MKWFLIVAAVITLFFVGISFLSIRVNLTYKRDEENDEMALEITMFKYLKFKIEMPAVDIGMKFLRPLLKVKMEAETPSGKPITKDRRRILFPSLDKLPDYIQKALYYMRTFRPVISYFERHTRFYRLKWHTEFGLYDPAVTGFLAGIIWSVKGYIYSIFRKKAPLVENQPEIIVIPNFQQPKLRLDINCIFDIKIGHIITGTILLVRKYLTMKGV